MTSFSAQNLVVYRAPQYRYIESANLMFLTIGVLLIGNKKTYNIVSILLVGLSIKKNTFFFLFKKMEYFCELVLEYFSF